MKRSLSAGILLCVFAMVSSCGADTQLHTSQLSEIGYQSSSNSKRAQDWNNAFRWGIPRHEKVRLISAAVRGIGEPTAESLLRNGYLYSKPSSWESFKNEMRRAANDRRVSASDLYRNTVEKYGSDNSQLFRSAPTPRPTDGWGCTFERHLSDSRRANCLADAVRGIGKPTADRLIRANEFRYAPRDWEAFKDYMKSLERRHHLRDLYNNTVVKYGSDNRRNLYSRY